MPNEYSPDRNNELLAVAKPLIDKYHSHLGSCGIVYLYRDNEKKDQGEIAYGEVKKSGELERFFTGSDFIITVYKYGWDNYLIPPKRAALMDNLLSHCFQALDKEGYPKSNKFGDPVWKIVKPDAKMFYSVLKRHGAWNAQTENVRDILKHQPEKEKVTT